MAFAFANRNDRLCSLYGSVVMICRTSIHTTQNALYRPLNRDEPLLVAFEDSDGTCRLEQRSGTGAAGEVSSAAERDQPGDTGLRETDLSLCSKLVQSRGFRYLDGQPTKGCQK